MAKKKRDPRAKVPKLKWREITLVKRNARQSGKYKRSKKAN
ncbi:MAG TPA: hypothetical protein PKG73_03060 [bacterium]|nr:hypothetical protein [bacterium]HOH67487.1 hypothetical protein [bacterium]